LSHNRIHALSLGNSGSNVGSGYISLEDGFIGGAIMRGTTRDHDDASFMEMGGKTAIAEEMDTRVTEMVLRCFRQNYRELMGV